MPTRPGIGPHIVAAILVMIALASPGFSVAGTARARRDQPNVLFLMCDQLTARVLSCYGGPVATPHIDRLAREGVRFNQAVCPTPFCSPTRASIVTGMYPHAHGIVVNVNPGGRTRQRGIATADVTTEKLLHAAGYATHHYGKWHLFEEPLPYYPDMFRPAPDYAQKMEDVFARVRATDPAGWMKWYDWALPVTIAPSSKEATAALGDRWKDARFAEFIVKMGRLDLPLEQVYDVQLGRMTTDCITRLGRQDKPFMITCSFNGPHDPNVVPSPYYEQFDPDALTLPANRNVREARFERQWSRRIVADLGEPGLREFLRIYYATIRLLDDQVGRILQALDDTGAGDDTIVIFTADHGDMAGGHGMVWKSTSAFYDEIATVPLLIRFPRRIEPRVSERDVDLTDLMPTILELAGQPVPDQAQGYSLAAYLTAGRGPAESRKYAFSERVHRNPQGQRQVLPGTRGEFMIRGQGWKYIRFSNGDAYLYHLADDPGETRNLVADAACAPQLRKLAAAMDDWLRRTGWPAKPSPAR